MTFNERKSQIQKLLGELTTAENAEQIAEGIKVLEAMEADHNAAIKDGLEAKNALVRMVTSTPVRTTPEAGGEPTHEDAPKDLDDVISESLQSVISSRAPK